MKKYNAKRFNDSSEHLDSKHLKHNKYHRKSFLLKLFLFILIVILVILVIMYFRFSWDISTFHNTNVENTISSNEIISAIPNDVSKFKTKSFDNLNYLSVSDLSLKYENNITFIQFDLCNSSLEEQKVFNFIFYLLDENGNILISYDLSSNEPIPGNTSKKIVLISTKDVTNAIDYTISQKK